MVTDMFRPTHPTWSTGFTCLTDTATCLSSVHYPLLSYCPNHMGAMYQLENYTLRSPLQLSMSAYVPKRQERTSRKVPQTALSLSQTLPLLPALDINRKLEREDHYFSPDSDHENESCKQRTAEQKGRKLGYRCSSHPTQTPPQRSSPEK